MECIQKVDGEREGLIITTKSQDITLLMVSSGCSRLRKEVNLDLNLRGRRLVKSKVEPGLFVLINGCYPVVKSRGRV